MATTLLFSIYFVSSSSTSTSSSQSSKTHLSNAIKPPKLSPIECVSPVRVPPISSRRRKASLLAHGFGKNSSNDSLSDDSAGFLDENGAVKDMDAYLNHLSLEYESVWDTKPSWCQPWTILLTGATVIAFSWLILQSVIVTALVTTLIGSWWYIFLYSYPQMYSDMIAERRRKVTSGVEDTYGASKNT